MEYIVLQPLESDDINKNVSLVERKYEITAYEQSLILHESGGPFSGFIVKKSLPLAMQSQLAQLVVKCDLSFKLKVLMKNANQPLFQEEIRTLEFWFGSQSHADRMTCSNSFFHNLLKGDFPKDYFLFLLKIMQIVKGLKGISRLKIDIERLGDPSSMEARFDKITSSVMGLKQDFIDEMQKKDPKQYQDIISGKILEYLERAFPNKVSVEELARLTEADPQLVYEFLRDLFSRGLVLYYDNGTTWIRNIINQQDEQIHKVVTINQQPSVSNEEQPTIAIITVNYYEKLAVDAMMTNKITFVRHKPEGESNVYTIGKIGDRRVISTKLPMISRDLRSAKISSGNATTRLLGIFQRIEHVFLVGCAGGVPHYSDFERHPRRGDIVVAFPTSTAAADQDQEEDFVYAHFEFTQSKAMANGAHQNGATELTRRTWMPSSPQLYKLCQSIRKTYDSSFGDKYPWEVYLEQGIESLYNSELDCRRPADDKLYFTVGEKNVIEASHPQKITPGLDRHEYSLPIVRFGTIGGGDESVVRDESTRHAISEKYGVCCFDSGMDQVLESIEGSRKESYIIVKGIVDYGYGMTTKEWQPYAALCAASFAKHLILNV